MSVKTIIPIILIILLILPEGECDCVQMCKNSACSQVCSRKKREGDEGVKRLNKRDFNGCQFTQMGDWHVKIVLMMEGLLLLGRKDVERDWQTWRK
uniref:Uncharacterized protein n=1 Tax=Meloidogyne enterolobii TaxID=390850 RepID=A0A6V7TH64_MELEN|nr:unnamed protein product [Meloidogyne enterolobii]